MAARAALGVDVGPRGVEALGGDHEIVAAAAHQPAEDLFRLALAVLVGGIEEVDAEIPHRLEHLGRGRLVGIAAEGHGAEAQLGDLHSGTAKGLVVHRLSLLDRSQEAGSPAGPIIGTAMKGKSKVRPYPKGRPVDARAVDEVRALLKDEP